MNHFQNQLTFNFELTSRLLQTKLNSVLHVLLSISDVKFTDLETRSLLLRLYIHVSTSYTGCAI